MLKFQIKEKSSQLLRTTLHNTYIYEHYCAFLDENIPTVKISVFELELGLGDCEGVYDLLPSGEGLGSLTAKELFLNRG